MDRPQAIVFVVDDDASVRRSLERLLSSAGYQVQAFASAADFLTRERYAGLGCIVLDVRMPGQDGMELQVHLRRAGQDLPIVFLTGHGEIAQAVQAMRGGAVDFLTKPVHDAVLLDAVQGAIAHHRSILDARHRVADIHTRVASLTAREHEVMRCVLSGARNKQIAARLGIAEKTIKLHRGRMMEKMGARSVADLVRRCERVGIEPDEA